jgi:hypothetical protein
MGSCHNMIPSDLAGQGPLISPCGHILPTFFGIFSLNPQIRTADLSCASPCFSPTPLQPLLLCFPTPSSNSVAEAWGSPSPSWLRLWGSLIKAHSRTPQDLGSVGLEWAHTPAFPASSWVLTDGSFFWKTVAKVTSGTPGTIWMKVPLWELWLKAERADGGPVPVAHTCNPNYSRGRDREDGGSKADLGK